MRLCYCSKYSKEPSVITFDPFLKDSVISIGTLYINHHYVGDGVSFVNGCDITINGDINGDKTYDITLNGGIDAGKYSPNSIFKINGLKIQNGSGVETNAGSGTLTVSNCNFENNINGAINGGLVYISNSRFIGNYNTGAGGAINMSHGIIENSYFEGNNCTSSQNNDGDGGAIRISAVADGQTKINNCVFQENKAVNGGAIYFYGYLDSDCLDINKCRFDGNIAYNSGGGIYGYGTSVITVNDTRFWNNEVKSKTDNVTWTYGKGGSIYYTGTELVINDSSFYSNSIEGVTKEYLGSGGAVYFNSSSECGVLAINKSFFTENSSARGGAIYCSALSASITDTIFEGNISCEGGAIYAYYSNSNCVIKDSSFISNQAVGISYASYRRPDGRMVAGNRQPGKGGGLFI